MRVKARGISAEVTIDGIDDLRRELSTHKRRYPKALSAAIFKQMMIVFRESQIEVPVDTGNLRASGYVIPTLRRKRHFAVTVGYNTHYMVWVHDMHRKRTGNGKSRYLADPFNYRRPRMFEYVRALTKRYVKTGRWETPRVVDGKPPPGRD